MFKPFTTIVFFFVMIHVNTIAQSDFRYKVEDNTLQIQYQEFLKSIHFVDSSIIKISARKAGYNKIFTSLVVEQLPVYKTNIVLTDSKEVLIATAGQMQVSIQKKDGSISFRHKGKVLLSEAIMGHSFDEIMDDSIKAFSVKQVFNLTKEEGLYGLGEYQDGVINRRGKKITMVQSNQQDVIPFLVSTNNYGIFWDNYSKTVFNDNVGGMSFWSEIADEINYYVVAGKNMDSVIAGYRKLTGSAPMFSRSVFGYWQSKERYTSAEELISIASEYRKRNIPIDYIVQDWNYWGGNKYWSGMQWDRKFFPDPDDLIKQLHEKYHLKFMISIWPCLGPESAIYKEMDQNKLLYYGKTHFLSKQARVYDAFSNKARNIYFKYIQDSLLSKGVDALWMDGTEPELDDSQRPEVSEQGIKKAGTTAIGSLARYLNAYSLMTTKGTYEGQRATTDSKRVFTLTRSAFAGQQRYGAATWSGDNGSNWNTLKNQIAGGIDFSMAGIPYWTHDIGGFFPGYFEGQYPLGVRSAAWRELYVRWFQFGVFTSIFRSHGTGTRREIWNFGEPGDEMYDALIHFNHLRYRLLPYIYNTSWQVHSKGYGFIRGAMMESPSDTATFNLNDQYIFGSSFLVKPVTREMYHPRQRTLKDIPVHLLTTDDGKMGLEAEYFSGNRFNQSLGKRIDTVFTFNDQSASIKAMNIQKAVPFSIRWKGVLHVPETGEYILGADADDGVRIWIDDKLIVNEWFDKPVSTAFNTIFLNAQKQYKIRIEYYQNNGGAEFRLGYLNVSDVTLWKKNINTSVSTYLPKGNDWFDFWTGKKYQGGQYHSMNCSLQQMPLFIKAGTILPMGDTMQYSTQKRNDTLEIRVYSGKNGELSLYEDENDNYNYEKGIYSIIGFTWDDKRRSLTIHERKGTYPGMSVNRLFKVVLVNDKKGSGIYESNVIDKLVPYSGKTVKIQL